MYLTLSPHLTDKYHITTIFIPIIILILALGAAIGISILGLVASNWSLTIDSDFAGYMTADSTLKL